MGRVTLKKKKEGEDRGVESFLIALLRALK